MTSEQVTVSAAEDVIEEKDDVTAAQDDNEQKRVSVDDVVAKFTHSSTKRLKTTDPKTCYLGKKEDNTSIRSSAFTAV